MRSENECVVRGASACENEQMRREIENLRRVGRQSQEEKRNEETYP